MKIQRTEIETPAGRFVLFAREAVLVACGFKSEEESAIAELRRRIHDLEIGPAPASRRLAGCFRAWFDGRLDALDDVDVETGGTPFQRSVWRELRRIPAGTTLSYSELAARIGRPGAVRAVASANARNPLPVIIPCHRVIGRNGDLTGYGGGLDRKRWLLDHETRWAGTLTLLTV